LVHEEVKLDAVCIDVYVFELCVCVCVCVCMYVCMYVFVC
jgi:hypothetical protein